MTSKKTSRPKPGHSQGSLGYKFKDEALLQRALTHRSLAYETDPHIPHGAVIVFGPFMSAPARENFKERAAKFPNIRRRTRGS